MKISGIYKIVNKTNGKYYIGSSINIRNRWYSHKTGLMRNVHPNLKLQRSWNKYGQKNFDFIILSTYPSENIDLILQEEQKLLDIHCGDKQCYNLNNGVINLSGEHNPFYGKHHTNKIKQKMSKDKKIYYLNNIHNWVGRKHSTKSLLKMSLSQMGRYKGDKSNSYDFTIYTFKKDDEIFTGTRYHFCKKYNLHIGNVCWLVKGKNKSVKGWTLK